MKQMPWQPLSQFASYTSYRKRFKSSLGDVSYFRVAVSENAHLNRKYSFPSHTERTSQTSQTIARNMSGALFFPDFTRRTQLGT